MNPDVQLIKVIAIGRIFTAKFPIWKVSSGEPKSLIKRNETPFKVPRSERK